MSKPSLLVLAAGIGSRYGGFKQIDPVGPNGEIIIDYSIYDALRAGFGKIVILTRPELETPIREHLQGTLGDGLDLVFVFQRLDDLPPGFSVPAGREKPWGTGHAIWAARHAIDSPFAVINADDFYGLHSYQAISRFLATARSGEFGMAGFELEKTLSDNGSVSRGICRVDNADYLIDVQEHTKVERDALGDRTLQADGSWQPLAINSIASMNLWGFEPSVMSHLELQFRAFLSKLDGNLKAEFFIPDAVDMMIKVARVRCKVLRTDEQWFGVTYRADRELAASAVQSLITSGIYPESLRGTPSPRQELPAPQF